MCVRLEVWTLTQPPTHYAICWEGPIDSAKIAQRQKTRKRQSGRRGPARRARHTLTHTALSGRAAYTALCLYATRPEVRTRGRAYTRTSESRREHTARRTQRPPRVPCHTRERHRQGQPKRGAFGFTARLVSHTHDITVHRRAHRAPHDRSSRLSRPRAVASPYPSRELSRSSRCVSALSRPTPLSVSPSPAAVQALHVLASIHNYTT